MNERDAKTQFVKALEERGFFTMCTHDPLKAGVPDVYGCRYGISLWAELKHSENDRLSHPLTSPQSLFLRNINEAGGIGVVVISRGGDQWHYERITEVGERNRFEYTLKTLAEVCNELIGMCRPTLDPLDYIL